MGSLPRERCIIGSVSCKIGSATPPVPRTRCKIGNERCVIGIKRSSQLCVPVEMKREGWVIGMQTLS